MMKQQRMVLTAIAVFLGFLPIARAEPPTMDSTSKGWGVLSQLAERKFVWNSGRARGSDASELTFHEFRWRGDVLAQTQCSYWPLRSMKAVCGTNLIEKLPDGSLLLKANGGKPYFKGSVAADGSVEFVNKTLLGKVVTAFVARPDGAVVLMHGNRIDGESRAPLLPVDAAREAAIMSDMEAIFAAAQAQKREEAERRYASFMGAMEGMNAVLSAGMEVATANEARSRASLDETLTQAGSVTRTQAASSPSLATVSPPIVGASAPPPRTRKFGWCVAVQSGVYMDAPGAVFLSTVDEVDWSGYQASEAANAFGEAVVARYGAHPGSASCNSWSSRTEAETRWQEQHDTFGLKFYKKVATGLPAAN